MATSKVKGTSKKIKELKGVKPEKITDKQLEKVQNTVNSINRAQLELGSMELKKHDLMHHIVGVRDELTNLQKEFQEEYGTFDIDIQTGTINYPKENGEAIRKISIGKDYKNDAMHYAVGQEVYGGHTICDIIEEDDKFSVYIKKDKDVLPWKDFNKNMAVSVEYNLEY